MSQPRRAAAKKTTSKKDQDRKKTAQTTPGGEPKTPQTAAKKHGGPTLRDLVLDLLTRHHEPRMVSEVAQELTQAHPDRPAPSTQVVRNTLEALVAKSAVERERRQGSVFYTARTTGPTPDAATEAAAEV